MKEITTEEVRHIAKLSKIEFSDGEAQSMREHIQKMLWVFETLDAVDVSAVPPTAHILPIVNVLRDDTVEPSFDNEALLSNAPKSELGAYIVPRVVE
ncbi:MAG: Asp-tRNA(Asn)/Glu-tRNA(Gln) amidotransferase subunit GatC [Clostridiales bacterium]|nr:Asp-tRNA(Asn)/Glu-tRNA(Gln) amidotransferase subunit GatC [Clostridiales bacterium]